MSKEPTMHEVMFAEMRPDVYAGKNGDEHRPQWYMYADGDMDSDTTLGPFTITPSSVPPGTIIRVYEPHCPDCELRKIDCNCGFDWHEWADEKYS